MNRSLRRAIDEITDIAEGFGLDFYPMRYEICPAPVLYTFGAYGMPSRFSHWSFGKQFHKMKLQYDLGMSKIYELVINSNPCYAFLLNTNSLVQNKLIIAHVLAHCDFFKNNVRFRQTNRDMVQSMNATAERIKRYEEQYGRHQVESFIDAVMAIEEHVDPSFHRSAFDWERDEWETDEPELNRTPYHDLWELENKRKEPGPLRKKRFPPEPEKDVVLFIQQFSRELTEWQRDIMTMLREEMLYFWPQMETKIMNEGWATYWHQMIMRELDLTSEELIEYAKLNAGVVQPSTTSLNPYYLGLKMFQSIKSRWDDPDSELLEHGVKRGDGHKKLFEIRELDSDQSFIRNYLSKELVEQEDLFLFQKKGKKYEVIDKQWESVRDELVSSRINGGFPYIVVEDGDYLKNGELYLMHNYEGTELDVVYLEHVLPHLYTLWGRAVHLQTVVEERPVVFLYNGRTVQRRSLT